MTWANAATLAKARERLAERYSGETVEINRDLRYRAYRLAAMSS
jgi:hypothetical protein